MHFWVFATRVYERFSVPRKIGLNWFIPAFVNSSVGSSCGTTGELGTNVCPCRWTKKSMNCWRICWEVMLGTHPGEKVPDYSRVSWVLQGGLLTRRSKREGAKKSQKKLVLPAFLRVFATSR